MKTRRTVSYAIDAGIAALSLAIGFALLLLLLALALAFAPARAHAATITIVNLDGPGEGFNDPSPAAPVGGNPGTTIGAQRLYVFQFAANIWGALLPSAVEILVEANFDPLDCDGASAVLGSAGPNSTIANFPNAGRANTWYHQALANKLAGSDQDPGVADIGTTFNSDLGKPECFPSPWYYGVDGNEGTSVELLPVVLHELAHGLGFSTSTLAGVQQVFPHIYDWYLWDRTQNLHWPDMTDAQRAVSAQNCSNLLWDGASVRNLSPGVLGPKPLLRVNAPAPVAGDMEVGTASFGAPLGTTGVTGDLVLGLDPMPPLSNACEPLTNAAAIAGKVALLDRGGCTFVTKARNAQDAGAIAVVVADSVPGCPALGMSGVDPAIVIPVVRITTDDGAALKAALLTGPVHVTLRLDPALAAGGDGAGRVQVFTPTPFALGSSVSHWDMATSPDLLMEPALNTGLSSGVDLTTAQFADIGWFDGVLSAEPAHPSSATRIESAFPNPAPGAASVAWSNAREGTVRVSVFDLSGRLVARLVDARLPAGRHVTRWDGRDRSGRAAPAGVYQVRLEAGAETGSRLLALVR